MPSAPDVIIVGFCSLFQTRALIIAVQIGAGPTGLVAAIILAQNGVPVRIIDKVSQPALGQRGAGVMVKCTAMLIFHA
jgi:2-polyprenyl-6-methoxyphenol hydroxylase-like FAD-dependent oxidoreductase